jgi:chromosome segregation ATPase
MVLLSTISFAATDLRALLNEKDNLLAMMDIAKEAFLENETKRPRLEQRKSDLDWTATKVKKEIDRWNAANAQLQTRISNHESAVSQHNSRCSGTYESQSYVDECNQNADRLNSYGSTLNGEIEYNEQRRQSIQEMIDTQNEQERLLQQEIDQYNMDRDELIEAGLKIQRRIDEIDAQLGPCRAAITAYDASSDPMKDGTMENMKAACGNLFDGN